MSSLTLRPVVRRHQIIRSAIRRYATKTQTQTQQATQSVQSTAQSAATSVQSTASSTATSAQQSAANAMAKAQDALNKGLAAAGPMAAKLGESTMNVVNKVPGGGNKVVGAVQGIIPPTIYYSKVVAELGKHIWHGQKMAPPSLETFQKFYSPYYAPLLNPSTYFQTLRSLPSKLPSIPEPTQLLETARSMPRKDIVQYAVWAAEFLGFFTVGQMIGRRKIVGYRGGVQEHH